MIGKLLRFNHLELTLVESTGACKVVGSAIDDLVQLFLSYESVRIVCWCCVIPRAVSHFDLASFHHRARILNNYVKVVLESTPNFVLLGPCYF